MRITTRGGANLARLTRRLKQMCQPCTFDFGSLCADVGGVLKTCFCDLPKVVKSFYFVCSCGPACLERKLELILSAYGIHFYIYWISFIVSCALWAVRNACHQPRHAALQRHRHDAHALLGRHCVQAAAAILPHASHQSRAVDDPHVLAVDRRDRHCHRRHRPHRLLSAARRSGRALPFGPPHHHPLTVWSITTTIGICKKNALGGGGAPQAVNPAPAPPVAVPVAAPPVVQGIPVP